MASVEELLPSSHIFKRNEQLYPLLKNIIDKCKSEAKYNTLHIPLEKYESRVSYYTGIPREVIQELSNEIKTSYIEPKKISMNITQRILIYDTLRNFYELGETPSFKDVHEVLKNNEKFPELTQFTEQMEAMGFDYRRLVNGKMLLMEDPKITFERSLFLKKIKKIRSSSSQMYYIDERIIDKKLSFKKPWLQNIDKDLFETENLFIFFHVVSYCDGIYVAEGLFCNQGSESDFQKWIVEILVNNIKPASTILMDRSPLHGVYKDKTISRYHPKEHMLKWLKENDIPCTANMNKAQLYELIRKCPTIDKQFTIDRILKAHGHNVLRLPRNFHDLSLTEFMWKYLSTSDIYYTEGLEWETIQSQILEQFKKIPPNSWLDFVKTTEKFEDDMQNIDDEIEKSLENYQFVL